MRGLEHGEAIGTGLYILFQVDFFCNLLTEPFSPFQAHR